MGAAGLARPEVVERIIRKLFLYIDRMPRGSRHSRRYLSRIRGMECDARALQCAKRSRRRAMRGVLVFRLRSLAGAVRAGLSDVVWARREISHDEIESRSDDDRHND